MQTTVNPDLYQMLGVAETASQDEIRKAYRELARKYHPDKTGGDKEAETRLKGINAAYDVLKNKEKRAEYDQRRKTGSFEGFDFGEGIDISDLFGSIFGGAGGGFSGGFGGSGFGAGTRARTRSAARPGNDLEARVRITLNDVVKGTKKTLRITRPETCSDCHGTGAAPGSSPITCPDCGGSGMVTRGSSAFQMSQTCPRCRGTGQTIAQPCPKCTGSGRVIAPREISVAIPAGIDAGSRLRVAGEGEAGLQGGPSGDLYVRVEVEDDPFFKREGRNLICEVPITFVEAALGAKVTVPTLDGIAKLTIEPGTQHGAQLRMRGQGLPGVGGAARGDEIVKVVVEVPRKLTGEQKRLLREFDGNYEPAAHPIRDAFRALLRTVRSWAGE
jgi:molecular chaperone DnaJ